MVKIIRFLSLGVIVVSLLAGSSLNRGPMASVQAANAWEHVSGVPDQRIVLVLASSPTGRAIFAGTSGNGAFRSLDGGNFAAVNNGDLVGDSIVSALAVSPNYDSSPLVLLGTASNGIYRSTNGGDGWKQVLAGVDVFGLAFAPDGISAFAAVTGGILVSNNGGENWHAASVQPSNTLIWKLAVSPKYATDHTVYAGGGSVPSMPAAGFDFRRVLDLGAQASGGFFKSIDSGETWTLVSGLGATGVSALIALGDAIFAGTPSDGVFRSSNGGATWQLITAGMGAMGVHALAASPQYQQDGVVFAGTWQGGVFKASSTGGIWSPVTNGFPKVGDYYAPVQALVVATGPDRVYAGTGGDTPTSALGVWQDILPARSYQIYLPVSRRTYSGN